jgi:Helix-turn-helix domain of resolvase
LQANSEPESQLGPLSHRSQGEGPRCLPEGDWAADRHRHRRRQVLPGYVRRVRFETNLRRARRLEGIANAKTAGVYKGRPASIDAARVRELKAQGLGATRIAKALGIGRASVYRVLEAAQ